MHSAEVSADLAIVPVTRSTPGPDYEFDDLVQRYMQAVSSTNELCGMLHNPQRTSLISLLGAYRNMPFSGNVIHTQQGNKKLDLPSWIVPMFAPFKEPYVTEWNIAFERAVEAVRGRNHVGHVYGGSGVILVPITSGGGCVHLLKQMIQQIDDARNPRRSKDGDPASSVKIVMYPIGEYKSCACVFANAGDLKILSPDAVELCHEPAVLDPERSTTADVAARQAADLKACKDELYNLAELHVIRRYSSCWPKATEEQQHHTDNVMAGGREGRAALVFWRRQWYEQQYHDIVAFFHYCRGIRDDVFPVYDSEVNIYEYLTAQVADDPHGRCIPAMWVFRLGLCNVAGVELDYFSTDSFDVAFDCTFRASLPLS
jgi:hypothetical protein